MKILRAIQEKTIGSPSYRLPECFEHTNRFYDRANKIARLLQKLYFINDYVIRKKYKVIDYKQEFQQELTFVLPFAYWHYLNGTLKKTISSKFTRELYFFSRNHEERYTERIYRLPRENFEIPNIYHSHNIYFKKWARVPLKDYYRNQLFVFDKPLLIIANKYNREWNSQPINYLSVPVLDKIISRFRHTYQIVYNRPSANYIVSDNSEILDLQEAIYIRENYPDVLLAEDLYTRYKRNVNNYNHLQLMLYANCERFVSVHGGTAALASYFGGKNIIFSKLGYEHRYNEFKTLFPALSGAEIYHAREEEEIFKLLDMHYKHGHVYS